MEDTRMLRMQSLTLCANDEGQVLVVWCRGDGERMPLQCRDAWDIDGYAEPWVVPAVTQTRKIKGAIVHTQSSLWEALSIS